MTWRSIKADPHPTWNGTFLLCDARVGGGHMTAADWDWGRKMWFSAELIGYSDEFFTHWWDFGDYQAAPDAWEA
jgi:hypothetical protein